MEYWYIAAFIAGALVTNIILDHSKQPEWWESFPPSANIEDRR